MYAVSPSRDSLFFAVLETFNERPRTSTCNPPFRQACCSPQKIASHHVPDNADFHNAYSSRVGAPNGRGCHCLPPAAPRRLPRQSTGTWHPRILVGLPMSMQGAALPSFVIVTRHSTHRLTGHFARQFSDKPSHSPCHTHQPVRDLILPLP
jgi:hypothetical protein